MAELVSIPSWVPFLKELCKRWIAQAQGDRERMGDGVILLPGRRAARALAETFALEIGDSAALLPRLMPIGDVDDAELELLYPQEGTIWDMPSAVGNLERLSALSKLILTRDQEEPIFGNPLTLAQAWPLAQELARLIDEAQRQEVELAQALTKLSEEISADVSEHWQKILQFLRLITHAWPLYLSQVDLCNPVQGQMRVLKRQLHIWQQQVNSGQDLPIWAVGFTHATRGTMSLLEGVAHFPKGKIVFPEIDKELGEDVFKTLPDTHPQKGIADILSLLGKSREDVILWEPENLSKFALAKKQRWRNLSQIMYPERAFLGWDKEIVSPILDDITYFEASDPQQQARGISMIMRQTLEEKGKIVALVTPDRALAELVSASLERWGIVADDSAGVVLSETPGGIFLRLLANLVRRDFTPSQWLAVFKHPLARCGMKQEECRSLIRQLEKDVLRGASAGLGFDGIEKVYQHYKENAPRPEDVKYARFQENIAFMDVVMDCLKPLRDIESKFEVQVLIEKLLIAARNITQTKEQKTSSPLWQGEEGRALSFLLAQLLEETKMLPPQRGDILPSFLDAVLTQKSIPLSVHAGDRAVHPRVRLWGCIESRLQEADVVILGGLSEGVWPVHHPTNAWLNRLMRERIGLPSEDAKVGESAYDFCSLCARADKVILTSSRRRDDNVAVPSRWFQRMEAYVHAQGYTLKRHPVSQWLELLDMPKTVMPMPAPRPRPEVSLRPTKLSVTEIETFLADPYSIYAKHILKLTPLDTLFEQAGGREFGIVIHGMMEWWWMSYRELFQTHAGNIEAIETSFFYKGFALLAHIRISEAMKHWWLPRIKAISSWVVSHFSDVHISTDSEHHYAERRGEVSWQQEDKSLTYRLTTRADCLTLGRDGSLDIIDYKTGNPPKQSDVQKGWNPQLPMEAAIAFQGGFAALPRDVFLGNLRYIRLYGGNPVGKSSSIFSSKLDAQEKKEDVEEMFEAFKSFWKGFSVYEQPYLSCPYPQKKLRFNDYALLSRFEEWQFSPLTQEKDES